MYLKVIATADAKKDIVEEVEENVFVVSVRAPSKNNLANKRIRVLMAEYFEVPPTAIKIVAGHRSKTKKISVGE